MGLTRESEWGESLKKGLSVVELSCTTIQGVAERHWRVHTKRKRLKLSFSFCSNKIEEASSGTIYSGG
jgi:hypothetical protein